ncbi:hypothetical protein TcWFU_000292 [Taenia crassiceps]|uniref:Uncharacterized protein n=1 Tax=Taenia crassiceps TaxID=6207 RepID=A0ABR4QIU5_9CEST
MLLSRLISAHSCSQGLLLENATIGEAWNSKYTKLIRVMIVRASSTVFRLHLLLLVCLISELLTVGLAVEIHRTPTKRMQRPAFLFDAWGKRSAPQRPLWSLVGEDEDSYLVVIPKRGYKSVATELEDETENLYGPRQAAFKRGAYLDLPWG